MKNTAMLSRSSLLTIVVFVLFASLSYLGYRGYQVVRKENTALQKELSTLNSSLELTQSKLTALENAHADLEDSTSIEARKNELLEQYVNQITNTVASFEKLSKLDPELLKKYSKVYFLNENYIPISLATIPVEYTYDPKVTYQFHADAIYFLQNLLDDARRDGLEPLIISAYRSFATQASVKALHKIKYGAGTSNQFSAEQGFSEHQLGTTVDMTTPKTGANFLKFETTKEYAWLQKHAHMYGFILSYPKGNVYYAYEPWHWRFVGVELATRLHDEGKYFYAYDQRTVDAYLPKIFDR